MFTPGQRIGAYEILEPLGSGGMGDVYRGRDTRLGRPVAIKSISAKIDADGVSSERFEREARLASSLNHPGIVTVHDVGSEGGRPFIVMELIVGAPLGLRLVAGALPLPEAVDLGVQIAEALTVAHAAGVVHRDLKPQNVMITADGRAKIVDFGLSTMAVPPGPEDETGQHPRLTGANVVLGTHGYMAPEQIRGRPADFRADQFAFGVLLYEMLAGRHAFSGRSDIETVAAILSGPPSPIREIRPEVPPPLAAIIERCLKTSPDERYASTADLARALRRVRDPGATSTSAAAAWPGSRRWSVAIVVVLAAATIGAVGVATWPRWAGALAGSKPAASAPRQIVVLPFTSDTGDDTDRFLAAGLSDAVTAALYRLQRLDRTLLVVSPTDVSRDRVVSADEAHRSLGATLAITGVVRRGALDRQLTLTLLDAVSGRALESRDADVRTAGGSAVAAAAAELLGQTPTGRVRDALMSGGTTVPQAFDAYVKARGYLLRFETEDNVARAIELFQAAIAADPNYAFAHAGLGEAYWRRFELAHDASLVDLAVDSCKNALRIDGGLAPVNVTLALIARGRGRPEEAIAAATRATELDPTGADGYRELAAAYAAAGDVPAAERTFQQAVTARPDDWAVHNALGGFYYARGRSADAEASFLRVVKLTPDNVRGLNNLGAAYFQGRRYEEAAATWERSMAIRPNTTAASNLGTYYFEHERYADAVKTLEQAVQLTATDYRIWRNLGAARYWAPGERPHAAAAYTETVRLAEQARAVNPKGADTLGALADAYSMLGRAREAREAAAALERLNPADPNTMFGLAQVYEQIGDRTLAIDWLKRAVDAGYSRERVERSPTLEALRKDPRYAARTK